MAETRPEARGTAREPDGGNAGTPPHKDKEVFLNLDRACQGIRDCQFLLLNLAHDTNSGRDITRRMDLHKGYF